MKTLGIYVHIPFCEKKCNYCDFFSGIYNEEKGIKFLSETIEKIKLFSELYNEYTIDTIYFGGGTPSVLPLVHLERITNEIYKSFKCKIIESTIEVNPNSSSNIAGYPSLGFNRISLGVQTLNNDLLHQIGRLHNSVQAVKAIELANKHFKNISLDMMIGLPNQTEKDIIETIEVFSQNATHISQYMLKVEEGTRLFSQVKNSEIIMPDEDVVCDFYKLSVDELDKKNFKQYEISNFCKDNNVAIHNTKYWKREPYLGIGKGAHSHINEERFEDYFINKIHLTEKEIFNEEIMLNLRISEGLNFKKLNTKYGINFLDKFKKQIMKLNNFLIIEEDYIKIKPKYFLLQNSIVVEFLI